MNGRIPFDCHQLLFSVILQSVGFIDVVLDDDDMFLTIRTQKIIDWSIKASWCAAFHSALLKKVVWTI